MVLGSFVFFFVLIGLLEANACPSNEDMTPCECKSLNKMIVIICKEIFSPEELIAPMRALEESETNVSHLKIIDSTVMYLPDNIFKNVRIEKVAFWRTEIMSFSESDTAFSGLEEFLLEIEVIGAKSASHWDFEQLRNLKKLQLLKIDRTRFGAVDHPFPRLNEITNLIIGDADISYVTDYAFSNLPKLKDFDMEKNKITVMKRNMFPNPANSLSSIDLRENMISSLPGDFFENMPRLRSVYLQYNKFTTLSEKPFLEAFRTLRYLFIMDNDFRCDCRMHWLVNIKYPLFLDAQCASPQSLYGRRLLKLDLKSLWCL